MTTLKRRSILLIGFLVAILMVIPSAIFAQELLCIRRLSATDLEVLGPRSAAQNGPLLVGSPRPIDPSLFGHVKAAEWPLISEQGEDVGRVAIFLFNSTYRQDQAYDLFSQMETQEGIEPIDTKPLGERSLAGATDYIAFITYVRCEAVVTISIDRDVATLDALGQAATLAKEIDARLQSRLCE